LTAHFKKFYITKPNLKDYCNHTNILLTHISLPIYTLDFHKVGNEREKGHASWWGSFEAGQLFGLLVAAQPSRAKAPKSKNRKITQLRVPDYQQHLPPPTK
jgi:hypothetical protein